MLGGSSIYHRDHRVGVFLFSGPDTVFLMVISFALLLPFASLAVVQLVSAASVSELLEPQAAAALVQIML